MASNRFLCQASSLDFLSRQNFDFNKLFREGISYLKSDDEKKLRASLEEKRELRRQSNNTVSMDIIFIFLSFQNRTLLLRCFTFKFIFFLLKKKLNYSFLS